MSTILSKKQKTQMRDRRKRKVAALKEQGLAIPQHLDSSFPVKKRKLEEETSSTIIPKESSRTIVIPLQLSAQQAKKFRKDSRRQAKLDGIDIVTFLQERDKTITPPPTTTTTTTTKPKKTFPRINDILMEQKKRLELQQLEQTRIDADAKLPAELKAKYLALDCEMVGIGTDGKQSALARVSIVDWDGNVVMDTFVQVPSRVTDFRTHVSGVTAKDIKKTVAMDVIQCRRRVAELIKHKILVGHALRNDLQALLLQHPKEDIRDTATYRPFQRLGGTKWRPRKLRDLVKEHLGLTIQVEGESHESTVDANAAMELFKRVRDVWEKELTQTTKKRKLGIGPVK